ncbi:MAG: L,D-transpeptidase [Actinomycetota bacterium]
MGQRVTSRRASSWRRTGIAVVALAILLGTTGCVGEGGGPITGKRIIYSNGQQRVVLIDEHENVYGDFPVSGKTGVPKPGLYQIFNKKHPGRSGNLSLPFFSGFAWGVGTDIGFHGIPLRPDGTPIQSDAELGQPRSAGCVRVEQFWAEVIYHWAPIGTPVVVQG